MDQYAFESLHYIVTWWEEAEKNVKLKEITKAPEVRRDNRYRVSRPINEELPTKQDMTTECRNELLTMYNKLFQLLLARKLPFSSHEIDDFEQVGTQK